MATITTTLFPPPLRALLMDAANRLTAPFQLWFQTVQNISPLKVADTSGGSYSETLPSAGLSTNTGQSNQNQEITYLKATADGNTLTINGAQGGPYVLVAQYEFRRFKSDGTNWWAIS